MSDNAISTFIKYIFSLDLLEMEAYYYYLTHWSKGALSKSNSL